MISELEKKIVFRYLKTKKKDGFLNVISIFSFIGISLGVAVLIIVMSVMNGFRSELVNKIVGFNSHVIIQSYNESVDKSLIQSKYIKSVSKNIIFNNSGEVVLINKNFTKGLSLRGYRVEDFKKLEIFKKINYENNEEFFKGKTISIGKELSFYLNLDIGDTVLLMSPTGEDTIIGNLPKQENYKITSIFDSGLIEFDQNVAFINIENLEGLLNLDSSKRNIEIYLNNPLDIEKTKTEIQNIFQNNLVYTWADLNKSLFSALKVERNVMFIILTLIIIVAAFNIISGLTILVKNKTKEIAILRTLGISKTSISKIFFLTGFTIGFLATITGVIIGILFSYYIEDIRVLLTSIFNIRLFPEEIYFLSQMPSEINLGYIFIISLFSLLITFLATIFPSLSAAKLDPVKALKYE